MSRGDEGAAALEDNQPLVDALGGRRPGALRAHGRRASHRFEFCRPPRRPGERPRARHRSAPKICRRRSAGPIASSARFDLGQVRRAGAHDELSGLPVSAPPGSRSGCKAGTTWSTVHAATE